MKVTLNPPFQSISGTWGNLIFVTRNGRTFAYERRNRRNASGGTKVNLKSDTMKLTPVAPIQSVHGKLLGDQSNYHVRTNRNGTIFAARNGNPQRHPSPAQLLQQDRMRQAAAFYDAVVSNPDQLAYWKSRFAKQSRYKSLHSFIIASFFTIS